ncbi:MAG TPA: cytochrome c [Caldilineaceae bacterium]|nr:cytochrome c [Caldilineaceae bacterium]
MVLLTGWTQVRGWPLVGLLFCLSLTAGCTFMMRDQPRFEPFEESAFFADGASSRPPVEGAVARGQLRLDDHFYTGRVNGRLVDTFPFTVTIEILERGQERYNIFCSPCHGLLGDGHGIVTEYGMRTPDSFHDPALREASPGYYFETITDGTRIMPSYAARIPPEDRWAIVAYIRALQLSQHADPAQAPPDALPAPEQSEATE